MVWRRRVTAMPWRRAAANRLDGAENALPAEDRWPTLRFHVEAWGTRRPVRLQRVFVPHPSRRSNGIAAVAPPGH
jgi:hypothetical protein